jgi:predicted metalloprotease
MRWRGKRKSSNIEDRRSMRVTGRGRSSRGGGLLGLLPMVFKFLGFKGTAIVVVCLTAYGFLTGNLGNMLDSLGLQQSATPKCPQGR